jgi:Ribosomal protein L7/L12 C-terminal domain
MQPTEKGEFTVVLQATGQMKLEVVWEVRFLTGLGLKEVKDFIEGGPKNVKEGVGRNDAEKIWLPSKRWGLRSRSSVLSSNVRMQKVELPNTGVRLILPSNCIGVS